MDQISTSETYRDVRKFLKQYSVFRELISKLRESEVKIASQIQSPDSSDILAKVRIVNLNYVSKTELVYLSFLCYYLNTIHSLRMACPLLLSELLIGLPEKIQKSDFTQTEKNQLFALVCIRQKMYLYDGLPFSPREIGGIINDIQIVRKLSRRTYQKLRPRKPRRTEYHRGYRDHGSARPPHRWIPKFDYSLTEMQNEIEAQRQACKRYYEFILKRQRFDIMVPEDNPTIFDL